jgi:NADH-quinone oxidoreductase subunit H
MVIFTQIWHWLTDLNGGGALQFIITFVFSFGFVMTSAAVLVYLERKIMGFMQDRYGPLHNGPWGLFQIFLDPAKLLLKEDVSASMTDNVVFHIAPMVFFAPVIASFVILPFSPYMTTSALATGIIYYVALSSLDVIGVIMAGWGSNNKYALIGGLRSAAQMISYELPLVLSLIGVVMLTSALAPACQGAHPDLAKCSIGSISLSAITVQQMHPWWLWFVLIQPLGLLLYYTCGLAETNRTPFDLPEAESELVAGYLTEYSGMRWALFFLGEYGNMVIVSSIATALFLGGWSGPGANLGFWTSHIGTLPGQIIFNVIATAWFIIKMYGLLSVFIWVRATLPRLRADQLMQFAWLILIPLTLANILILGIVLLAVPGIALKLVVAGIINWAMLVGYIAFLGRVTGVSPVGRMPRRTQARPRAPAPTKALAPIER